ncbi:MAG: J domain-containing protein [Treponema sp.]|jgi:DnaJ like chaperone protein|nr:J domain-containing protein [Treponema sp.]
MKFKLKPQKYTPLFVLLFAVGGYFLGIPGMITGVVLGYFVGGLWAQLGTDKGVLKYFENPGPSSFNEGDPGLAAFCALGVYIMSRASPKVLGDDAAAARIAGGAVSVFPQGKKIGALAESFCRLAFIRLSVLNPDLLTESLAARRRGEGDLALLGSELASMAMGREAQQEALYIRQYLDPSYQAPPSENPEDDPWKVLGIPRGASYHEVKSTFRRLALKFHPDNQPGLDDGERKKLSEVFIKIRDAYRVISREIIK